MFRFIAYKAGKAYRSLKMRWAYLTGKAYPNQPYAIKQPAAIKDNRPRVLHFIGNFFTGGSSRLVVDLLEHLGAQYEQHVITQREARPAAFTGAVIKEYGQHQTDLMRDYIADFKPDFVHVHYWAEGDMPWYTAVFDVLEAAGCRVIENVNVPVAPYRSNVVDTYVYVSQYVKDTFGSEQDTNKVIYPGSDFKLFKNKSVGVGTKTIGMVYRLDTDKLNSASIDVFIKVAKQMPTVRCLVVGGGALLKEYRRKAIDQGVVRNFEFTGYVSYTKLPRLYRRMSIFVAPVWKESFGQVTPFAMHMGIPVVGYRVGALEEIIGNPDLLAPTGDSERLAEIILELLADHPRRKAIGKFNQARTSGGFSVESMVGSYRELYAKMVRSTEIFMQRE